MIQLKISVICFLRLRLDNLIFIFGKPWVANHVADVDWNPIPKFEFQAALLLVSLEPRFLQRARKVSGHPVQCELVGRGDYDRFVDLSHKSDGGEPLL